MRSAATTEQTAAASASVQGNAVTSSRRTETPYGICTPRRCEGATTDRFEALRGLRRNLGGLGALPVGSSSQGRVASRAAASTSTALRLAALLCCAAIAAAAWSASASAAVETLHPY